MIDAKKKSSELETSSLAGSLESLLVDFEKLLQEAILNSKLGEPSLFLGPSL
jgi:hypothetical protein